MDDQTLHSSNLSNRDVATEDNKVELSVRLDATLVDKIGHLTHDPSKVIETALRQWLRGDWYRDADVDRTLTKNPPVPLQGEWND
jgi:hypothetical protein